MLNISLEKRQKYAMFALEKRQKYTVFSLEKRHKSCVLYLIVCKTIVYAKEKNRRLYSRLL